jgi:multidrug efflux pump subunit AcrA (membrane-fusion protein)
LQNARFTTHARYAGALKCINDESRRVAKQPMRSGRFLIIHRFKENSMKTSIIAALAFAAFAASGFAQAADNATTATATQTEQSGTSRIVASPKTRADVRHELVQAQKDGQLASLSTLYRGR